MIKCYLFIQFVLVFFITKGSFTQNRCLENINKKSKVIDQALDYSRGPKDSLINSFMLFCDSCLQISSDDNDKKITILKSIQLALFNLSNREIDSSYKYIEKALLYSKGSSLKLLAKSYFVLGEIKLQTNEFDSSEFYYKKSLSLYLDKGVSKEAAKTYQSLAKLYLQIGDNKNFYNTISKGIVYTDSLNLMVFYGRLIMLRGRGSFNHGLYDMALGDFFKSYNLFKNHNSIQSLLSAINNIAMTYGELNMLNESREYFKKGMHLSEFNHHKRLLYIFRTNLAENYLVSNEQDSALSLLNLALSELPSSSIYQMYCFKTIGRAYVSKKDFDIGGGYLKKALKKALETNTVKFIAEINYELANIYYKKQNYKYSLQKLDTCLAISIQHELAAILAKSYLLSSRIYEVTEQYKEAYYYKKKGDSLITVLSGIRMKNTINSLKVKFGTVLKEKENKRLILELENKQKQEWLFYLVGILLTTSLISLTIVFLLKNKSRNHLIKISQVEKDKISDLKSQIIENNKLIKSNLSVNNDDSQKIIENLINNKNWAQYMLHFESIHPQFLSSIKEKNKNLTKNDLRFLSMLKLMLSDKEISNLLSIEKESVRRIKYRIKSKIQANENSLDLFN